MARTALPSAPPASAPDKATAQAAPVVLVPFTRGSTQHTELVTTVTQTMTTSAQTLAPIDVPSFGFLRSITLEVVCTTSSNAATVAFKEDGPFSVFDSVTLMDVNGAPIFRLSGYDAYLVHKYGGFAGQRDPKQDPDYAATSGSGGTGGSFTFRVTIPVEINGRDALGSLANMNAAQTYKLVMSLNASSNVYSTAPTTLGSVAVKVWLNAWSAPYANSPDGLAQAQVPPANMTTMFFSSAYPTVAAGQQVVRHTRVGNLVRLLIYVLRRTSGTRANGESDLPNPMLWMIDSRNLTTMSPALIRSWMANAYNFTSTTFDAAGGPDNGVFVLPGTINDLNGKAGYELRDQWLPTTQATRFELSGSFGNAGTLQILTCDVAPRGDVWV